MQDYRFIIIIFGEKHIGMLLTNLYLLAKNIPDSRVSVFWQDIPSEIKNDFKKAFAEVDFIDTNFDFSSDEIKRISSKTFMWNHAAKKFKNSNLCFIDVDMLVIKNISKFFDYDFNIMFTHKNDRFPLNTGILFCKGNNFETFFKKWLEETLVILNDCRLLTQAASVKYPFGGADQMSFYKILNYSKGKDKYEIIIDNKKIIFQGISCDILNETTSTKIKNTTHAIHYKGGWQPILLEGKGFTKYRSKKNCWEMYLLYLKTHKLALEYFNKSLGKNYKIGSFGIKIPFYLNKIDFKENKPKYAIFYLFSCLHKMLDNTILLWKYIIKHITTKNMPRNKADSERNIEEFSREIKKAAEKDKKSFLTWFDNNENLSSMVSSGYKNFFCCVLKNEIYDLTKVKSDELTALEIGCGGGRIMNAATKYFRYIIGLDIHDNLEETDKFLRQMGNQNFETKKINDFIFPITNEGVDFIYSFIVFQHLMKMEVFFKYLQETTRILKKDGLGIIYFGRPRLLSKFFTKCRLLNTLLTLFDKVFFEEIYLNIFRSGFMEYPEAKTNYVNLVVSIKKARKIFANCNLKIIGNGISAKDNGYGCQYYFSFRK